MTPEQREQIAEALTGWAIDDQGDNSPLHCVGKDEALEMADELAPLLAEAERRGAEKGWDEGYGTGKAYVMAAWEADQFPPGEPPNPYRADQTATDAAERWTKAHQ